MRSTRRPLLAWIDWPLLGVLALFGTSQFLPFSGDDSEYPGWLKTYYDFLDIASGFCGMAGLGWTDGPVNLAWVPVVMLNRLASPLVLLGAVCLAVGHRWHPKLLAFMACLCGVLAATAPTFVFFYSLLNLYFSWEPAASDFEFLPAHVCWLGSMYLLAFAGYWRRFYSAKPTTRPI